MFLETSKELSQEPKRKNIKKKKKKLKQTALGICDSKATPLAQSFTSSASELEARGLATQTRGISVESDPDPKGR